MSREFESILRIMRDSLNGLSIADAPTLEGRAVVATSVELLTLLLDCDLTGTGVPRDPWASPSDPSELPKDAAGSCSEAKLLAEQVVDLMNAGHDPALPGSRAAELGHRLLARHRWVQERLNRAKAGMAVQDVRPPRLNADRINAYFRGAGIPALAKTVSYIPGGYSRETISVTLERDSEFGSQIVMRKVVDGHDPKYLFPEWEVIRFAHANGMPAPKPFWLERDPLPLGNSFFAVSMMPGRTYGDVFGRAKPVAPEVMLQLARYLARLHTADVEPLTSLPRLPLTSRDTIATAIDQMGQVSKVIPSHHRPIYDLAIGWLRANIPAGNDRPALIHGDVGLHNLLLEGGTLTAILDWERSHLGDPAEELAYVFDMVTSVLPWDVFMDEYVQTSGVRPDPRAMRFYSVWQDVWRASGGLEKLSFPSPRISAAAGGYLVSPRFLLSAANRVLGIDNPI
jgi:aminoglycoside phosphotransferase (APT) family kinase protein